MTHTNRKPVDELADIRERIKDLKFREGELRDMVVAGECDAVGDEFTARVSVVKSERLDTARLRKELGPERIAPFLVASESTVVRLEKMRGCDE